MTDVARRARAKGASDTAAAVDAWMVANGSDYTPVIAALREVITGADAAICEGVKWNHPSFFTSEYFATVNLRTKPRVRGNPSPVALILHFGAKKRDMVVPQVADPRGLLQWLAPDRAMLTFDTVQDVTGQRAALAELVRAWIVAMEG